MKAEKDSLPLPAYYPPDPHSPAPPLPPQLPHARSNLNPHLSSGLQPQIHNQITQNPAVLLQNNHPHPLPSPVPGAPAMAPPFPSWPTLAPVAGRYEPQNRLPANDGSLLRLHLQHLPQHHLSSAQDAHGEGQKGQSQQTHPQHQQNHQQHQQPHQGHLQPDAQQHQNHQNHQNLHAQPRPTPPLPQSAQPAPLPLLHSHVRLQIPYVSQHPPQNLHMASIPDQKLPPQMGQPQIDMLRPMHDQNLPQLEVPPLSNPHHLAASGEPYSGAYAGPGFQKTATQRANGQNGQNGLSERQRMRVNKACERCRSHKIKCSGIFPCKNCLKHSKSCTFRPRTQDEPATKRQRTEELESPPNALATHVEHSEVESQAQETDPSRANPALDHSSAYVSFLENRVQYLEKLIVSKSGAFDDNQAQDSLNYRLDDMMDILQPTSTKWRICRRFQGALAIQLCSSLYESLSPESKAQVEVPRTNYYGWNMSGCNYLKPKEIPKFIDLSDVPLDRKAAYVDYFFKEINPLYAILHETVFREQFDAFQKMQSTGPTSNATALFLAMICCVYALSIRFTEFSKPEGPLMKMLAKEEEIFQYAYDMILLFSREWESFELIQCWQLAALYLRITHRQVSCFNTMGHAISMCRSMGLGRFNQVPNESSPYERLKAKRIFWSVYTFDRIIGLQGGRFRLINDSEINRSFPQLNFEEESSKDDWITLPALAMIHVARLANFLETARSSEHDYVVASQITYQFEELRTWLDSNGFNESADFEGGDPSISPLVKAQVKYHFYELLLSVQSKTLFNYFGHRASIEGMNTEVILHTNESILKVMHKVDDMGLLFAPWYLTLQLILTVGVTSLVFLNNGKYVTSSRIYLKQTMKLLQKLKGSLVRDANGKLVFKQRFKMVEECEWLFKMMSHIMSLSFEESIRNLGELGTDHGSSDVNKVLFTQFSMGGAKSEGDLDKLMKDQNKRELQSKRNKWDVIPNGGSAFSPESSAASQPKSNEFGADQFLDNLAWFDQWLDFNHDL